MQTIHPTPCTHPTHCLYRLVLRSQHTPHQHVHFATHVSHDADEPSRDHPACPMQSGSKTVECEVEEEKSRPRTTVSFECDPLCSGATEVIQDSPTISKGSPTVFKGKSSLSQTGQSPSPNIKKKVSTSASSSPMVKKLSHEGPKGIASPTKASTPILKKSGSLSADSPSPRKKEDASALTEATSSASSPSGKERKSSKQRKGKKDGATRKERKRGLSSSSSDDPKMSRSRTESAGSETLDAVDQEVIAGGADGPGDETGAFSVGQEGSDHMGHSTPYLTTPTDTPSPAVKTKTSKKKQGKGGSKRRKHGSKRERGLSSSSDDPKSSRSRTVSQGSEVPCAPPHLHSVSDCDYSECGPEVPQAQVTPSKDPAVSNLDTDITAAEGDDSCFAGPHTGGASLPRRLGLPISDCDYPRPQAEVTPSQVPAVSNLDVPKDVPSAEGDDGVLCTGGASPPKWPKCDISVSDYDYTDC